MTSGQFNQVSPDFIWVDRATRQRRELKDIDKLAGSIQRRGLINPPVIARDGQLIAGERRWEAIKSLGWTSIPVQYIDELDEGELKAVELEENIKRLDLPWQDECLSVKEYHDLHVAREPGWTQSRTADALGMTDTEVSQKLGVAKELLTGNQRVIDAPKYSTARGVVERVAARKATSAKEAIAAAVASPDAPQLAPKKPVPPLLLGDFHQWVEQQEGPREWNFIHCDFPYGVNADQHDQGQGASQGGYRDDFETYDKLVDALATAMLTTVADSAHLMFWFSMDYYAWTKNRLELMGWQINPFPLIWYKNDNTGILPDPKRGPRRIYETAFMGSRGDRLITARGAVANAIAWPGKDKEIHMSEKPVGMLKHFMSMMVDEYSLVLDPTCGSGNALKAAQALGAQKVLGIERDPEFYQRATEAYFIDDDL